ANAQQRGGASSGPVIQSQGATQSRVATRTQRQARTARAQVNRSARIRTRAVPARGRARAAAPSSRDFLIGEAAAFQGYPMPMMVMIAPMARGGSRSANRTMQMMYDYAGAFQGYPMPMMVMIAPMPRSAFGSASRRR